MKSIRRSLFLQHLIVLIVLLAIFVIVLSQFTLSYAKTIFKEADTFLETSNLKSVQLIIHEIKSNDGNIKKSNLSAFISNLQELSPSIEKVSIYNNDGSSLLLEVGTTKAKTVFKPTNTETHSREFIEAKANMSQFDKISYSFIEIIYGFIIKDTKFTSDLDGDVQLLKISNIPSNNLQINIISAYRDFENRLSSFIKASVLLLLAFSLIILIFFSFIQVKIINPLRKLKKSAIEIAKGNLRAIVPVKGYDEIGIVGTFFSEVARNLREITSELYEKDRLAGEVNIAAKIQEGLIPPVAPDIPGLDIKLGYKAAEEVGGDSLDFVIMDEDNILFYIGDVSGHGIPAGLVMTMVDVLVHGLSGVYNDIDTIMININRHITPKIDASMFMTLLLMNWNHADQKLSYVGGGHESIIHYKSATREVDNIKAGGIAIGMIEDNTPLVQKGEIKPEVGDVLVLYTDGIPEAWGGDSGSQQYGMDRFIEAVRTYAIQSTAELIFESLTEDLSRHMGISKQMDDITLIVIKYVGISAQEKNVKLSINKAEFKPEKRSGKWNWNK